jgi:hypothetical protein
MLENDDRPPRHEAVARQIRDHPCRYRHTLNQTYYGIKKCGGKRKPHPLEIADRKDPRHFLVPTLLDACCANTAA